MTNSERRKLRKGAKKPYLVDRIEIVDGVVSIVRTIKSGRFWSLSFYDRTSKRIQRKTLRTKDVEQAKLLAIKKYAEIAHQIERGESPFAISVAALVETYLADQKKRITTHGRHEDGITRERYSTIRTGLKHYVTFVGSKTKIDRIPSDKFLEYYRWRREKKPGTKRSTLKNEHSLITNLYKYAVRRGLVRFDYVPEFDKLRSNTQKYSKKEDARDAFSEDERDLMLEHVRNWHEGDISAEERYNRRVVRDYIEIDLNTGLRPGEMWKLKWSAVELGKAKSNRPVKLTVDPMSKTGSRPVQGVNGDAFAAIRSYSEHTNPSDWVFADWQTGEKFKEKTFYRLWHLMMKETGLAKSPKKLVPYSLRHTYCTERLMERTEVNLIAQNMGTSIQYIQDHYGHVNIDLMRDDLSRASRRDARTQEEAAKRAEGEVFQDRGSQFPSGASLKAVKVQLPNGQGGGAKNTFNKSILGFRVPTRKSRT